MKASRLFFRVLIIGFFSLTMALPAYAIILPMPGGSPDYDTIDHNIPLVDGIPVASHHDDFWSYSNQILRAIQKQNPEYLPLDEYGSFDFAAGTGGLDVLLFTGAGGANNQGVGPEGAFYFEDPVPTPGGKATSASGSWGQDVQEYGPVTVGQVLDYLEALTPGNSIPAFYMDLNQTGADTIMTFTGQVRLMDGIDGDVKHVWAFDNDKQDGDGVFDVNSTVSTPGYIPSLIGDSGTDYGPIDHNKGSGKADFIAFAPTMDLNNFNKDWLFVVDFHMTNINNGFEEIYLTGLGNAPPPAPIPEPGTLVLLGAGLIGWAAFGRKKLS